MNEGRMCREAAQGVQPNAPFSQTGVTVLFGSQGISGIVEMNRPEMLQPNHPIKLSQNTLGTAGNVVAGIPDVTGIQSNMKLWTLNGVQNHAELLKTAANFRTLARHGFQ